ncbi:glucose-6-phosphate isomerase family protein [Thermoanaerobacter wiegelii]|uniref:glucose-6-phosphate isomerase n=1 Tax=Thermoanaerobacter wiegelii Rt8.B1 TaxID=697303 RepID=G2MTU6_9THEO|nr:glucose-6-phosphate isomerase family protein [Thermoanaerobacter wiegelii]AEM79481.1 glucose-6-phosphate isomerase [Thermoanaerobacter wiegelii Rt8.B1]
MRQYYGIEIIPTKEPLGFIYGKNVFGPEVEYRRLEDIRKSLLDPMCEGPEIVYAIAMDVGKSKDKNVLIKKNLLFGIVTYASGRLGKEPVRSQGHIHALSRYCNCSTPEIFEIWTGEAVIYMQEKVEDNPDRCFAVYAKPKDIVIVPPGWAHYTVSANTKEPLTFLALCVRDYGFEYERIRSYGGLAWYPILEHNDKIEWVKNNRYKEHDLTIKDPRNYDEFSIKQNVPLYEQFEKNPDIFEFVSNPNMVQRLWNNFIP